MELMLLDVKELRNNSNSLGGSSNEEKSSGKVGSCRSNEDENSNNNSNGYVDIGNGNNEVESRNENGKNGEKG